MSGGWGRRFAGAVLVILAVVCWACALGSAAQTKTLGGSATLCLDGAPLSCDQADDLLRTEQRMQSPLPAAVWKQTDFQRVQSELGRDCAVSVLSVRGESNLALPLSGMPLTAEDLSGCLIDRETARTIFGSTHVVGSLLTWQEQTFTVRGVFDRPRATMLVIARPEQSATLDRITIALGATSNMRGTADAFALRHALGPVQTNYSRLGVAVARLGGWLPGLMLTALLGVRILQTSYSYKDYPFIKILFVCIAVGSVLGMLWLCGVSMRIPSDWIPSKWSDFSFWQRLYTERTQELWDLLWMRKDRADVLLFTIAGKSLFQGIVGAWCLRLTASLLRDLPPWLTACACLAGAFCGVLAAGGLPDGAFGAIWIAPSALCIMCHIRPKVLPNDGSIRGEHSAI